MVQSPFTTFWTVFLFAHITAHTSITWAVRMNNPSLHFSYSINDQSDVRSRGKLATLPIDGLSLDKMGAKGCRDVFHLPPRLPSYTWTINCVLITRMVKRAVTRAKHRQIQLKIFAEVSSKYRLLVRYTRLSVVSVSFAHFFFTWAAKGIFKLPFEACR